MSKGGRYLNNHQPKKPKKVWKIILIVLAVIVLLLALLAVGLWIYMRSMLGLVNQVQATDPTFVTTEDTQPAVTGTTEGTQGESEATEESTEPEQTWPQVVSTQNVTTFMLVGQDNREGETEEQHKLSDSMIMCTINRETNTLTMTSILRDCYVPLPAYAGHGAGRNRINVCYALGSEWTGSSKGGMEMLALCVEQNFGIPIDHTIEVGFDSFEQIIDLMGGVDIELTEAEAKYMTDEIGYVGDMEPGYQTLDGLEALAYARIRKIDADGDFSRTNRQRTIINSLLSKCVKMNLWDLHKLATQILPLITTDMSTDEMSNYIWEFLPMLKDLTIVSQQIPLDKKVLSEVVPGTWSYNGVEKEGIGNVMEVNTWSHKQFLQQQLGYADVEE